MCKCGHLKQSHYQDGRCKPCIRMGVVCLKYKEKEVKNG